MDITDYPSDVEDGPAVETAPLTNAGPNPVDPSEGGRRSLKDWVRSAQALLRTPQKHASCHVKTPDDSNKKRRKFERYKSEPSPTKTDRLLWIVELLIH